MRHALLALAGYRAGELGEMSHDRWRALDRLAAGHRMQPHLHGRLSRGEIEITVPRDIAAGWRAARRENALHVLAERRALHQAIDALAGDGIAAVVLKGSALAWSAWPDPAERPMRDIDILVDADTAPRAYRILRKAGWSAPEVSERELRSLAARETHLPPLDSPEGLMLELHAHVWASSPLAGLAMPQSDDAGFLARAEKDPTLGLLIPSAQDMLAHLSIHCAVSHLFNTGPLALADIDYLLQTSDIDWTQFWADCERLQFTRAAAIMLLLVDRWRRRGVASQAGLPIAVEPAILERAENLLCQDAVARKDINAIAGIATGAAASRLSDHPLEPRSLGERMRILPARGLSIGRSLLNSRIRRAGNETAAMARWLSGT